MCRGGHVWALTSCHSQGSLLKVDVQGEIRLKSFLPSGSGEQPAGWTRVGSGTGSLVACTGYLAAASSVPSSDRDAHRLDGRVLCGEVRTER